MKIAIIGSGGRLGAALLPKFQKEHEVRGLTHAQIDLGDFDETEEMISRMNFDLLINCAALTNVDLCEEQPEQAFRVNAGGPEVLAQVCEDKNARLIHFSTDYVFDGEKRTPYVEEDEAKPISVYGQSKREGEECVLAIGNGNLVVRLSWVFGPERPSFIDGVIQRARENEHVDAIADKFSTPTYTRDIAQMLPRFFDSPRRNTTRSPAQRRVPGVTPSLSTCASLSPVNPLGVNLLATILASRYDNWVALCCQLKTPSPAVLCPSRHAR
jgi:dTDP-4-dehydrorhamnose reductase